MAHVLIVSATPFEIQPLLDKYAIVATGEGLFESYVTEKDKLSVLITGVGMVNTAYYLGRYSDLNVGFVINAGICGSFQSIHKIGEVLRVFQDELIEMGAEDGNDFIHYKDLGLGGTNVFSEVWQLKLKTTEALKLARGITVNTIHGNNTHIEKTIVMFKPDVESMEGAAFFAGCRRFNNYMQIRAVSNRVEKRDKNNWNIPLAIENLNVVLHNSIEDIYRAY